MENDNNNKTAHRKHVADGYVGGGVKAEFDLGVLASWQKKEKAWLPKK